MKIKVRFLISVLMIIFLSLEYNCDSKSKSNNEFQNANNIKNNQSENSNAKENDLSGIILRDLEGNKIDINETYKWEALIIDCWATWCPPCNIEIPDLKEIYNSYKDKGFLLLGLSLDQNRNTGEADFDLVKKFKRSKDINYPILMWTVESVNKLGQLTNEGQISAIPTKLVFDSNGKFIKTIVGYKPKEVIISEIENLLKK